MMIRKPWKVPSHLARALGLGAMAVLMLGLTSCEGWVAMVADEVQEAYGLDIRDSGAMRGAAFGAQTLGDADKADALDVYRALRRVEYEEMGDRLLVEENYAEARQAYEEALAWTPGGKVGALASALGGIADFLFGSPSPAPQDQASPAQLQKRSELFWMIALTYDGEASAAGDKDRQMELRRAESRAWAQSAALNQDEHEQGYLYAVAATAAYEGGDVVAACGYLRQGGTASTPGVVLHFYPASDVYEAWGCK